MGDTIECHDNVSSMRRAVAFESVAMLLSTSQGKGEVPHGQEFTGSQTTSYETQELHICGPCLSLHHDKGQCDASHSSIFNRKHAEGRAVELLTRPMEVFTVLPDAHKTVARFSFPQLLLQNVYSSFAVLVVSRLHAYSDFLARHAMKLGTTKRSHSTTPLVHNNAVKVLGEKLEMMLAIAAQVEANAIATRFVLSDVPTCEVASATLRVHVTIDLQIPGKKELIVKFSAPGKMKVNTSSTPPKQSAMIELDTRELLRNMIQQAAQMVSVIVELASHACSSVPKKLTRSISSLEMPPPALSSSRQVLPLNFGTFVDTKRSNYMRGLELLSNAAAEVPVVSPLLTGLCTPNVSTPVDFDLTSDYDVVCNLSIDQCEDIIDTCLFGGVVDEMSESPFKRTKIG